jgi:hypothetical protein
MCPYDRLFLLEYPDIPIYLRICELFIFEVFEGSRYLILRFMIEHDVVRARGVVYLELRPHGFFYAPK